MKPIEWEQISSEQIHILLSATMSRGSTSVLFFWGGGVGGEVDYFFRIVKCTQGKDPRSKPESLEGFYLMTHLVVRDDHS